MKGLVVPSNQHQRKEVLEENIPMSREIPVEQDEMPEVCRAAIYLCGPERDGADQPGDVPPIYQQRVQCRYAAAVMHAEVVGEFGDESLSTSWRAGLHEAVLLAGEGRPFDYLIVYSRDLLARDRTEMFDIAWRLGVAGTAVIAIDENDLSAWTER
jgi:DNA invertase Pin-like site-specific DNA recombinase